MAFFCFEWLSHITRGSIPRPGSRCPKGAPRCQQAGPGSGRQHYAGSCHRWSVGPPASSAPPGESPPCMTSACMWAPALAMLISPHQCHIREQAQQVYDYCLRVNDVPAALSPVRSSHDRLQHWSNIFSRIIVYCPAGCIEKKN